MAGTEHKALIVGLPGKEKERRQNECKLGFCYDLQNSRPGKCACQKEAVRVRHPRGAGRLHMAPEFLKKGMPHIRRKEIPKTNPCLACNLIVKQRAEGRLSAVSSLVLREVHVGARSVCVVVFNGVLRSGIQARLGGAGAPLIEMGPRPVACK